MRVTTHHFTFDIDRADHETETTFRAVVQFVRHLLNHSPHRIRDLPRVLSEARETVQTLELGLGRERHAPEDLTSGEPSYRRVGTGEDTSFHVAPLAPSMSIQPHT